MHLVKNGTPISAIVVPEEEHALVNMAATHLVDYVEKITGAKLSIVRENAAHPHLGIYLGATKAAKRAGIDVNHLKDDGFVLKVADGNLFVAGRDILFPSGPDVNNFMACRGTLMGVFRLLEDCGGVGWFLPTPQGEYVPKSPDFSVPDDLDRREEPAFSYVSITGVNKCGWRMWPNGYRRAINMDPGVHTWDNALYNWGDPDELFAKDPTIFAQIDGERRLSYGNRAGRILAQDDPRRKATGRKYTQMMLCTSHPDFVEMNVKYFSKLFDAGYQWAGYGQSDGYQACQCDRCRAADGIAQSWWDGLYKTWSWDWELNTHVEVPSAERLWSPIYEFTRQLYKKYPDRKIIILVYHPTFSPSKKFPAFSPNVAVELCCDSPAYFDAFKAFKSKTVYTYWFGTYRVQGVTPKAKIRQIAQDMQRYRDNGVMGIHSTSGGEVWALEGPAYYAYGRLGWNPDADVDEILNRYCKGVYRAAGPVMKEFFDLLEERIAIGDSMQTPEEQRLFRILIRSEVYYTAAFPPDVLDKLDALLKKARTFVKGDAVATGWLAFTELQYRHLKLIASAFNLYREYESTPRPELRTRIERALEARTALVKELEGLGANDAHLQDWFPGYDLYMQDAADGGRPRCGKVSHLKPFAGF